MVVKTVLKPKFYDGKALKILLEQLKIFYLEVCGIVIFFLYFYFSFCFFSIIIIIS